MYFDDIQLIATSTSGGGGGGSSTASTTVRYVHTDHLGGTNVVTNSAGTVVQVLDYYPYGGPRIKSGTDVAQREFIGQMFDESSSLNYLNARYYDSARGQFLSQDPMFWGDQHLKDPQKLNSYAYGRNNPIAFLDTSGWDSAYFAARPAIGSFYHIYSAYSIDSQTVANQLNIGMSVPNNVSASNPLNFTIGFMPASTGALNSFGKPLIMNVESSDGGSYSSDSWMMGDYEDAAANGFKSSTGNMSLGSYGNYAQLANAAYQKGGAIMSAGNPYSPIGDMGILSAISYRNWANSNSGMGAVARSTGQGSAFNQISSSYFAPGSDQNAGSGPSYSGGGSVNGSTPMLIGNSMGAFVGTYNFGPGVGTYNFGTQSWQ
jgi:RHS repeat-associated protein